MKYNENIIYNVKDELQYIQFKNLKKYDDIITHCFTTRLGGFSLGECSTLNLGFNRNDTRENVMQNYIKLSDCLNVDYRNMVFSNQVHDSKIKVVDESDRGKGIIVTSDIIGYDGLMTDKRQVVLVTFYADCVPLFFFDPVKKVIALSHSGWRGTVKEIGCETLEKMKVEYGCRIEDVEIAIGPSIHKCCFEVGAEVYEELINKFEGANRYCEEKGDKWYIDLQGIIKRSLVDFGANEGKICLSGVCTKCNNDVFFSHRGDKGKTGSLAAIMQLN